MKRFTSALTKSVCFITHNPIVHEVMRHHIPITLGPLNPPIPLSTQMKGNEMINEKTIRDKLHTVIHPELKRNLIELGMVKSITLQGDSDVTITLALPYKEIPIKGQLIQNIQETVEALDNTVKVAVETIEMNQQERASFMGRAENKSTPAQAANKIAHVIAVLSGKGGVGKSSVAALLAVALRRRGLRVGVLDADITGPSQPKIFGLHQHPQGSPLGILPVSTNNDIKVMSINLLLQQEDQAVIWRGPLISSAIKQFWNDVVWHELDYLVVDLPPGTSDAALTVMQSIPLSGVVLVTSPQDLAGMVVRKAAGLVERQGAPIVGLVENMSYATCPQCGSKIWVFGESRALETAEALGVPILGKIPLDPELARHCDRGEIELYRNAAFEPIAERVLERSITLDSSE